MFLDFVVGIERLKILLLSLTEATFIQGSQYRTGGCIGLASGTIYFGYQSIPVYRFGFIAILYNNNNNNNNNSLKDHTFYVL